MSDLLPPAEPTHIEMIRCIEREIRMRERVYPRWVTTGRMSQRTADIEIATMKAVLKLLEEQTDEALNTRARALEDALKSTLRLLADMGHQDTPNYPTYQTACAALRLEEPT